MGLPIYGKQKKQEPDKEVVVGDIPGTQTVFLKTYGCAHNKSDSEYMAGQLVEYGYTLTEDADTADVILINSCTVKGPSQDSFLHTVRKYKGQRPLVVAGCVPQADRTNAELESISVVGVQQLERVTEVVEETLKGNTIRLFGKTTKPSLDLPKIRKNELIEIIPISLGCLSACTYCKTKHARGHLGSYEPEAIIKRVKTALAEGVKEIWLTSEDSGAYGRDIGTTLPALLKRIVEVLPSEIMLRLGMTNPPYILDHLEEMAEVLNHPNVYAFIHLPVQSGSNKILATMRREYTCEEFEKVCQFMLEHVPGITLATDVICGFPGETEEDFEQTLSLIERYKFPIVNISQFYPRPNTPAAKMKRVPTEVVKERSRKLTKLFESFAPFTKLQGTEQEVVVTEIASDGHHLVGHTKSYVQVLLPNGSVPLGWKGKAKITKADRFSVWGTPEI